MIILECDVECELLGMKIKITAKLVVGEKIIDGSNTQYCLTALMQNKEKPAYFVVCATIEPK